MRSSGEVNEKEMMIMPIQSQAEQPPWEAVAIIARHLDPKSIAIASCVSKSWYLCFSSDQLWSPICSSHFPTLHSISLHPSASPFVPSYHRLYALGHSAAQRRIRKQPKPTLSLDNLLFAIDVYSSPDPGPRGNAVHGALVRSGRDLNVGQHSQLFRFEFEVGPPDHYNDSSWVFETFHGVRVTWNVVLGSWERVFTLMDSEAQGGLITSTDGFFSNELPAPGCCPVGATSEIVADVRFGVRFLDVDSVPSPVKKVGPYPSIKKAVLLEKMSLALLTMFGWTFLTLEDGLTYLQHFLCDRQV